MFCKRRNPVMRNDRKVPVIVLPQRQCITRGESRSMSHEVFSTHLANFVDQVLKIDSGCWDDYSHMIPKDFCTPQVNTNTLTVRAYPSSRVYGNMDLPIFLYEWDWETVNPDEALHVIRSLLFTYDFFDVEGEFQLIEKLPVKKESPIQSHTICRWPWNRNSRFYFTERDWVEYYGVDTANKTIISRSVLHPVVEEYDWTPMKQLLGCVIPFGTIRGEAFFAHRFLPPKPGKKGCVLQNFCWNSLGGAIDPLTPFMSQIWVSYFRGTMKQFARYNIGAQRFKTSGLPTAPFDLL